MKNFAHDFAKNIWSKRIDYNYRNGRGLHRYYVIINCFGKELKFEFHHLKPSLVANLCGKRFYETFDIPGTPPKSKMTEFKELIVTECKHQFKVHQVDLEDSLIPENLY